MLKKPWNFRKHKPLTLRRINSSITCLHVMEIEDEEIGNQTKMVDAKPTRSHVTGSHATVVTKDWKSSPKCQNCGGDYPHHGGKTSCPAYQSTCRSRGKLNHFETVCKSKDTGKSSNTRRSTVHKVNEKESSDEDEVYTFSLSTASKSDRGIR